MARGKTMFSNYGALRNDALKDTVTGYLRTAPSPVFLCSVDSNTRRRVTAHVSSRRDSREIRRGLGHTLRKAGFDVRCRVRVHRERDLARAKSLEQLLRRFGNDWFLFDPTASLHRIRKIVSAARFARRVLGERLRGVYLEPRRRILYVVLDREAIVHLGDDPEAIMRNAGTRIAKHLAISLKRTFLRLEVAMTFVPPAASLVPVDDFSLGGDFTARILRHRANRRNLTTALITAAVGLGLPVAAQAGGPAVDGFNAKIAAMGGVVGIPGKKINDMADEIDHETTGFMQASVAFPLGNAFGAQLDGVGGQVDGKWAWAAGAHLFWRNPQIGLVGLIGKYGEVADQFISLEFGNAFIVDDITVARYGGEVEFYFGDFTVLGEGGIQRGDLEHGGYGRVRLRLYPFDDIFLEGGYEVAEGLNDLARFGLEFQVLSALHGLTIFADGAIDVDENEFEFALAGLRFYFGASGGKSLKQRHREDDPDSVGPEFLSTVPSVRCALDFYCD